MGTAGTIGTTGGIPVSSPNAPSSSLSNDSRAKLSRDTKEGTFVVIAFSFFKRVYTTFTP
jgi:hypothetical protein